MYPRYVNESSLNSYKNHNTAHTVQSVFTVILERVLYRVPKLIIEFLLARTIVLSMYGRDSSREPNAIDALCIS